MEVTVTLTIMGFILLMIFGAFRLGFSAWERGEALKEEDQRVRLSAELMGRQIKSLVPFRVKSEKAGGNYLVFEGGPQDLKFVSALSLRGRPQGLVYVIYRYRPGSGAGDGRLEVTEQRALNKDLLEETPGEEKAEILLEGLSGVSFEYYREENQEKEEGGEWVEEWDGREERGLPRALQMALTFPGGKDGKESLSVSLLINLPAHRPEEVRPAVPPGAGRRPAPGRP